MLRRLLLTTTALALVLVSGISTPAVAAQDDYRGTARLTDCSASVVRFTISQPGDEALVLTNGHCVTYPFLKARQVLVDQPSITKITLLDRRGKDLVALRAERLVYATMYTTDAALYRLPLTYQQLLDTYGISAFLLGERRPSGDEQITIPSAYVPTTYRCRLRGFAHKVHEQVWDWDRSLRYRNDEGCAVVGGTSGSPVLDRDGVVIGVNNTGYVGGKACRDTPCETDRAGRVSLHPGLSYGQQTWVITTCVDPATRALDLTLPACRLPAPRA